MTQQSKDCAELCRSIQPRNQNEQSIRLDALTCTPKGSRAEQHTTSLQSWKLASLSLLEIIFHLKDFQARDGGDSAVVGQKRLAVTHQRSRHLDRIRWLEFERCSQMGRSLEEATINFNKSQTSAVGQQR
jgi:hypothetical protein